MDARDIIGWAALAVCVSGYAVSVVATIMSDVFAVAGTKPLRWLLPRPRPS